MRRIVTIFSTIIVACIGVAPLMCGTSPAGESLASPIVPSSASWDSDLKDFSVRLRGEAGDTTLMGVLAGYADAALTLLFFDPDCEHCLHVIDSLANAQALAREVEGGERVMVAIFPTDISLPDDDPNMMKYNTLAPGLPAAWYVGTDRGSILEGDLYWWESLPLLLEFPSRRPSPREAPAACCCENR